jgi:hypothetical protein
MKQGEELGAICDCNAEFDATIKFSKTGPSTYPLSSKCACLFKVKLDSLTFFRVVLRSTKMLCNPFQFPMAFEAWGVPCSGYIGSFAFRGDEILNRNGAVTLPLANSWRMVTGDFGKSNPTLSPSNDKVLRPTIFSITDNVGISPAGDKPPASDGTAKDLDVWDLTTTIADLNQKPSGCQ